ncbi:MAG: hypothetical protein PHW53_04030 [Patescibacteria group bacterium]|nr:hypothetical protein [Patescibacteria group bacterium]
MEDQPNGFKVIVDDTTDMASVGDIVIIRVVALRGTCPVQNVTVFVTAEGSAHILDDPDITRMCIPDDMMGKENELREMLESTPSLNVGKGTSADGRADFTVCLDRPGDAKINISWLNPDTRVEDSIERLVAVFGDEQALLTEPEFISIGERMAQRELHCDVEAPDSVHVGSPAAVRARVREHDKAATGIMITLVPDTKNVKIMLMGDGLSDDDCPTAESDSGMTDSNGLVKFKIVQIAVRPETVAYAIEWDNNGTVNKIERLIEFAQKKEDKAMDNGKGKDSPDKAPMAEVEKSKSKFKRWWPVGGFVVVAAFLVTVLVVTSRDEWQGWNRLFGGKDMQHETDDSMAALTKVEPVPAPADIEPVVIAPSDAEAGDALEETAVPVEQTDMVIVASAEDETETAESSAASEEPEIYTWYSTDGVMKVFSPPLDKDLQQGREDAKRVQELQNEKGELEGQVSGLEGQISSLEGQISLLQSQVKSQVSEEKFVIPRRIKCLGEDYTLEDGWIVIHDCEPVIPKK